MEARTHGTSLLVLSIADALLANRATKFTMVSFKALFALVFVGLCFTTLQIALSFHGLQDSHEGIALYGAVFGFSVSKLVVCFLVRFRCTFGRRHAVVATEN